MGEHEESVVSPGSRKRKPRQPRKPVYDKLEWADFDSTKYPERKMRECISNIYLVILEAPPPEDWKGEGGTVSEIQSALLLKKANDKEYST